MKKRIAKKVKGDPKRYRGPQIAKAAKRLGESIMVMGIDMAADGAKDYTAFHVHKTETGRFSSATLNEASKPKTAFNHRTGQAPTTPGAIRTNEIKMLEKIAYDFGAMDVSSLREAAKAAGLNGYSTMKKADLVALLKGG